MLERPWLQLPNDNPELGRENGVSILPSSEERIRMGKVQKARAKGYYTHGKSMFKLNEGDILPENIDGDVFYYDEENPEERGVGLTERRLQEIADEREGGDVENTTDEAETEATAEGEAEVTTDEPVVETAAEEATVETTEESKPATRRGRGANK